MGYVDKNLMAGERIVYQARLHWIRYGWAVFWLLVGLGNKEQLRGLSITLAVALGILAFLDVRTSEFVVTNKRVYLKQGIIRRASTELLLGKIESVQVDQSLFGRLLNFGSITPGGSGGTKQAFHKVGKPLAFRQKVNEQIDAPAR